ncbi:hypothetical protein LXL04_011115 [Taraxacum kok-saghyz]
MIKNVLEGSEVGLGSFENQKIPENPRTICTHRRRSGRQLRNKLSTFTKVQDDPLVLSDSDEDENPIPNDNQGMVLENYGVLPSLLVRLGKRYYLMHITNVRNACSCYDYRLESIFTIVFTMLGIHGRHSSVESPM